MLKLNYTDCGLFLERVSASLDVVATERVMLAVCTGECLYLEPGRAAFLLPAHVPGVIRLTEILQRETAQTVTLTAVDHGFLEISLKGTWIANSVHAEAGTFITALAPECELLIDRLWRVTQCQTASY